MRSVRVSPRAAREIERADDWWIDHRPKAPGAVGDEVELAFERIASNAEATPECGARGLRRLYLRRIRYYLYYRIRDEHTVDVLSLWHAKRGDDPRV